MSTPFSVDDFFRNQNYLIPVMWLRHEHEFAQNHNPPVMRSLFDETYSAAYPGHIPAHQYLLRAAARMYGASNSTLLHYQAMQNAHWQQLTARMPGGLLPELGRIPGPLEPVEHFKIPDSTLVIRLWSGGLDRYSVKFFDFMDLPTRTLVKKPTGFKLTFTGIRGLAGRIISWEKAMGYNLTHLTTERFSVYEGSHLTLKRLGHENFHFRIPTGPEDPTFALPEPL